MKTNLHRFKISQSMKNHKPPVIKRQVPKARPVINTKTGEEYNSVSQAAKHVGVTKSMMSLHLNGGTKTCSGNIFKFKSKEEANEQRPD